MTAALKLVDRRIIPRWRSSPGAVNTRELGSLRPPHRVVAIDVRFDEKLREWSENSTFFAAAELVAAAIVSAPRTDAAVKEVLRAASLIQGSAEARFALARSVTNRVDGKRSLQLGKLGSPRCTDFTVDVLRAAVHHLRARVYREPRNALLWVDLARCYTNLGQLDQACRVMETALKIDHEDRFVLRSAIRFFLHSDDGPTRAHALATSSLRGSSDPWILAAEISVASIANVPSRHARNGAKLLTSATLDPFHLTELASAIGTEEWRSGNVRRARRHFRLALIDPTENSAAQTQWAARQDDAVRLELQYSGSQEFHEAHSWEHYYSGNWEACVLAACRWADDQSFSTWPVALGSYVSATFLEDYALSEAILRRGLIANPHDPLLLNNLTYALACAGRLEEAGCTFARIDEKDRVGVIEPTLLATKGLLLYRNGRPAEGALSYLKAIDLAKNRQQRRLGALATLFFAREELRATTATAPAVVAQAVAESKGIDEADVRELCGRLSVESDRLRGTTHIV